MFSGKVGKRRFSLLKFALLGGKMKKTSTVALGAVLAFLLGAVTTQATFLFDSFPSGSNALWRTSGGVIVSNPPVAGLYRSSANSFYIPSGAIASNVSAAGTGKVWTDFYTRPRYYSSSVTPVPPVDSSSTAQFYVNTNGLWVTISGDGGSGLITNICTNALMTGVTYPTVTTAEVLYHVSVLHDYTAANWSLFVQDIPLATNLNFINNSVTAGEWFQVQNMGGDPTWLDDFLVTNKMATSGAGNAITNVVPGTTIPVADALYYFGTVEDPRKTNQTIGASGLGVTLTFGGGVAGASYVVYGTGNQNLSGLTSNGVVVANSFTDNDALAGSVNRYFYKLLTMGADGYAVTNDETYAVYKQAREANKFFIVGVPVDFTSPSDRTMGLGRKLATQLAAGLSVGDTVRFSDGSNYYLYTLNSLDPVEWECEDDVPLTKVWPLGTGALVKRFSGAATSTILAGLKATGTVSVAVTQSQWAYLSWPYDDRSFANGAALGMTFTDGDYLYIQTNGAPNSIAARYVASSSKWKMWLNGRGPDLSLTLKAGDGLIYRRETAGGDLNYDPIGP